jgi:hypothetical protein
MTRPRTSIGSAGQTLLLAAAAFGLAGCGEARSDGQQAQDKASAALDRTFGEGFAEMSRADANAKPKEVKTADLPPVSLTDKPIDF